VEAAKDLNGLRIDRSEEEEEVGLKVIFILNRKYPD